MVLFLLIGSFFIILVSLIVFLLLGPALVILLRWQWPKIWLNIKNYLFKSKPSPCKVHFDWKGSCRVGDPVSFRISFLDIEERSRRSRCETDRTNSPVTSRAALLNEFEAQKLVHSLSVEISQAISFRLSSHVPNKIEYVKELDLATGQVVIKFSVRKAGQYSIRISYEGDPITGSPFVKRFRPCKVDAAKTLFLRPSPTIVCMVGGESFYNIQPRDKFGNDCSPVGKPKSKEDDRLDHQFEFIPKYADESLSSAVITSSVAHHVFITPPGGGRVEFHMLFKEPGIFKGQITYGGKPISNGQFDVLCITKRENAEVLKIAHDNPAWTSHKSILCAVGGEVQKKLRTAYFYISPKLMYVQEYVFKIIPIKIATFRVSPMTKIKMIMKDEGEYKGGGEDYTFAVYDGIQPKVTVQMNASKARTLLGLYCYFLRQRIGGTENFEGKQRMFYQELKGSLNDIRVTARQITVCRNSLMYSSMKATKTYWKSDWCKNFAIAFENEFGYDYGGVRREWLEQLCVQLFQTNEYGMFRSIGTSRLVHPNSSPNRSPTFTPKHYEFAGKIVGKCLFESSYGDTHRQMVNARFTRSFLAQVLGMPPNYQHFEQDDPELYISKVKYILENDISEMDLTFSEEEYDSSGNLISTVDLIPNGSKKSVSSENKEQYLNALAAYRLQTKVSKEIESFKRGLHDIVPEELLGNFDENELELLMCGNSKFDIQDLKDNCIKGSWTWSSTYDKLFNWFCTAISNMSDEERAKILQFTTGSSLLPHEGFRGLNPRFKISITNGYGKLPTAHTCFNEICLTDHDSYELFEKSLRTAITEGAEGFAFS